MVEQIQIAKRIPDMDKVPCCFTI